MPNPSGTLRKRFDLFANERPARSLPGVPSLRDDVDLVIVRENTEGFYADHGPYASVSSSGATRLMCSKSLS